MSVHMEFNPLMLTTVREAAGLTQSAIAEHSGVSQALVSRIENGFERPSDEFVHQTARLAEVPVKMFYLHEDLLPATLFDIFHKKRLTLPLKPLKKANACAQITRVQISHLLRSYDVPVSLPFPSLNVEQYESPVEVATLARAMWRVPSGPFPNLVESVEATGTPVAITDLGHEKLRAMSLPTARSYGTNMILLNGRLPASAQRFALAHEIGHLVMHEGVANATMEKDADAFASALLMPEADIKSKLRNVRFRDLGALKAYWRVSLAALIYRAHELGVISERHYRTLNMDLNKLPDGRKREPGEFPKEQPRLIQRVIDSYLEQGYTIRDLCELMVIEEDVFRSTYLSESLPPRLRVLRSR